MRIYLDVSCLNRPSDDQRQPRIRLETEAILLIFDRLETGEWVHLASDMVLIEIDAANDPEKRRRARALLPPPAQVTGLTQAIWSRAAVCEVMGFKPADAVHVAAPEASKADVLLTCDDRMLGTGRRKHSSLRVRIENPLSWFEEQGL